MTDLRRAALEAEIDKLNAELKEARAALPAHSVRPNQWRRVEDLEELIEKKRKELDTISR